MPAPAAQPQPSSAVSDGQRHHRAYHHHFAVREVDQAEDAVHHGVAQRDQRIDAALHQAVDDLLKKDIHSIRTNEKATRYGVALHDCQITSMRLAAGAPPIVCNGCHLPAAPDTR